MAHRSFQEYCEWRTLNELGYQPSSQAYATAPDAAQDTLRRAGFGGKTPRVPPVGPYTSAKVPPVRSREPVAYEPHEPQPRRSQADFYSRSQKTLSPKFRAKYNQYTPDAAEIERIVQLGREGNTPLGITLLLGDELNKQIPAHAVAGVLQQYGIRTGQQPDAADDAEYFGGSPEDYMTQGRSGWDQPTDLDDTHPLPKPDIKDMSRNPWPLRAQVSAYAPKKGEFGHGQKGPDLYDRAVTTTDRKSRAKYNRYKTTPDEDNLILGLARQGHTPLGISLELSDRTGKQIPAHVIEKLIAANPQ